MMEKRERNSYWVSMFGQNILYCIISTGLLYYFQNIIFIPVTFIGVVVLIAQIIDAVKDPIMGIVIDKTESRLGKCRFYLIIGLPIAMCATIIPFINGTYNLNNTGVENYLILIWVFVSYIIWLLAFTLIDVPLWSLASCITSDKKLREKMLTTGANFRTDIFFEPYRNIIFFVCSVPAAIGIVLSLIPMLKYDS